MFGYQTSAEWAVPAFVALCLRVLVTLCPNRVQLWSPSHVLLLFRNRILTLIPLCRENKQGIQIASLLNSNAIGCVLKVVQKRKNENNSITVQK